MCGFSNGCCWPGSLLSRSFFSGLRLAAFAWRRRVLFWPLWMRAGFFRVLFLWWVSDLAVRGVGRFFWLVFSLAFYLGLCEWGVSVALGVCLCRRIFPVGLPSWPFWLLVRFFCPVSACLSPASFGVRVLSFSGRYAVCSDLMVLELVLFSPRWGGLLGCSGLWCWFPRPPWGCGFLAFSQSVLSVPARLLLSP
ncbi:hypothetical protein SAMN02745168_2233 [Papillibacter cinnamivorans DSM 12816]|uniref:Uncharacterized protein n=1 Tax=Papillibacter cinnamivorans DSM 12816 TaxID=1122930 RepID=A0A1W2BIM9_9FIRM|nr:hypothetical protein SAMN02745168_2233 [Papillibacter cinnamivorans DSM 12816]